MYCRAAGRPKLVRPIPAKGDDVLSKEEAAPHSPRSERQSETAEELSYEICTDRLTRVPPLFELLLIGKALTNFGGHSCA